MEEIRYSEANKIKKRHPIERANILSHIFFCWLLPYFVKGFKRELNEDDMYETLEKDESKRLGDKLEAAWNYQVAHKKNPSLWMALLKIFRREIILSAVFKMLIEILRLSQPLFIHRLLQFYEPNQTDMTKQDAYMYAGFIVFVGFVVVLCNHNYQLRVMHLGMKLRVAACSLIYRKALKLSKTALAETNIGQMVNLLSNDVGRFDFATQLVHNLWIAPIKTVITMYLIYAYVGPTGLIGAFFLLLFIPFQMYMGKKTSQYRLRTAIRTDERVRLMSEIITGIQVIKMYTWEKPFSKLVEMTRLKEMQQIRSTSIIRAITMSCNLVLNRAAIYLCILTYVITGNTVNASYAFTLTSFYGILRLTLTMFFPLAVTQIAETNVSIKRIRHFLLYDEIALNNEISTNINTELLNTSKYQNGVNGILPLTQRQGISIRLKNVAVKWIHSLPENNLENINFAVNSKQLVAVVGTVGAGKTTLLHTILKELPPLEGSVDVEGTVSYASQEPWLFGGSIRQNIIFGQEFDAKKIRRSGARGVMLSGGQKARINLARSVYKDADIYLLDDPLSAVDTHVGKQLFDECICGYIKNKCVVLVTHQLQYLKNVLTIYLLESGKVQTSGSYSELKATEGKFSNLLADSGEEIEEKSDRQFNHVKNKEKDGEIQVAPTQEKEERGVGKISGGVYKSYLRSGGNWCKIILLIMAFVISQITASGTDYFISIWANVEQWRAADNIATNNYNIGNDTNLITTEADPFNISEATLESFLHKILTERNAIIIYSCLVLITITLTIVRSISFFRFCMRASTRLHNLMFNKIVYATMRFFNTNPPGRILNRFSKDIGAVDETLIFLATSRDVKRVEAVTRSPIYTHLTASLQGLTTIRAFGAQEILKQEFDNYQNKYTAAYFMFLGANRTFGFWLDFHCIIYIALVTVSILFVESEIFGGNVGLAITQSMNLTGMFQWGMIQWSELENQMTSVERIQEYIEIKPEADERVKEPPKCWPKEGDIKFDNMCLRYSPDDPYVLKNLTFEILPNEKIGIVGRTGAGKSSLIAALFRLTDMDGTILIDNVNTKEIPLYSLRSKISIIPQEPVLFSGMLRKNLDPFDEYNDEDIKILAAPSFSVSRSHVKDYRSMFTAGTTLWNALDEVELKQAVVDLPAGLDSKISEGGSNFSVGQRQLLCLARAVIRNNKILVLDEATANVDSHTDGLIQTTIRRKFADCTVLTIAHRLHTIMDSDKVLVMDAGKAVEFDHPYKLLQNPNGVFYGLVKQTGRGMAENLTAIAHGNYKNINL
ncbi:hypothetical protein NQ314_018096 [Rhamnusium bicolor]|uniref:Uncharacterized protein n=1 Tax=Rhamnusium bicolor TaxID=1586634 RepID=A0AAV8WSR8_9CUCU|nr:hypothetical protein NQ314_018096 [Rhamnusium bicolor]